MYTRVLFKKDMDGLGSGSPYILKRYASFLEKEMGITIPVEELAGFLRELSTFIGNEGFASMDEVLQAAKDRNKFRNELLAKDLALSLLQSAQRSSL